MSELTTRLRLTAKAWIRETGDAAGVPALLHEAANEIGRLKRDIERHVEIAAQEASRAHGGWRPNDRNEMAKCMGSLIALTESLLAKSPLDSLSLTKAQKQMLIHLGEARKQLQREKTPRCLECVRAIDDVAKEFTGDGEFFHTHGHRVP